MNVMNFKYLCQQYNLGRFQSAAELTSGTVSRVWKLDTDCGPFLVRTLTGREQGEREWKLFRHLRDRGFAAMPAIVVPVLEQGGVWYQVQEYLEGAMPDPALPGMASALADMAKGLSRALPEGMIHGDLGLWNLLLCADGRLMVIDFGEACPGDSLFDAATLFAAIINHTAPEQRTAVCGAFLREMNCDKNLLLEQVHNWAEQGKARWAGVNEAMTARFDHALSWAKEHIYEL